MGWIPKIYAENGQEEQEEVSANYEGAYHGMPASELLSTYTKLINRIAEKKAFGDSNMEDSINNFIVLNKTISE